VDPELIARIRQLDLFTEEQVAALTALATAGADDLDALEEQLISAFHTVAPDEGQPVTAEDVIALDAIAASVDAVRTERDRRPNAQAVLAAIAARVLGPETTTTQPDTVSTPAHVSVPLGMISRHRPRASDPRRSRLSAASRIFTPAGRELFDGPEIADEVLTNIKLLDGRGGGGIERALVASVRLDLPDERRLGLDVVENGARIAAVTSPQAITASGGICAPVNVSYDLAQITTADRPLRDSLAFFQADRGGVRFIPPPNLTDVEEAVGVWTEANDQNPTNPTTKPCLTVTCAQEQEVLVEAITRCLQFGNFNARTFPEQVTAYLELSLAAHARTAENRLWDAMATASTAVSTGQLLGAARDVLTVLDRATAQFRSRNRMPARAPLQLWAPAWLTDLLRADLARQQPGDNTLAVADAQLAQFFTTRNVTVTGSLDASQEFGTQGVGPLDGWPGTVDVILSHPGAFLFLDAGTLDLGIVRDSTLNATNDFQIFAETFEAVAFVGIESLAITMDVCANGETSGTTTINPCLTGS
jgi:hypothetical protein